MAHDVHDDLEPIQISPAVRRRLQQCYEHGKKLTEQTKYDHDYANKAFIQCVLGDPGNLVYVEAFLDNLQAKYDDNKKGAKIKGFGGRGSLKKAISKQDWFEILKEGPPLLEKNPWDVPTLRAMADACAEYFYNDVELRYLKNALDADPNSIEVNKHCAESLTRMAQFDQAIVCWHRVDEKTKGGSDDAKRKIADLTVEKTRARGGIEGGVYLTDKQKARLKRFQKIKEQREAESAEREESKPTEESVAREPRKITLTRRQELERAVIDFPSEIENYFELADILAEENRYADAQRVLTKAQQASGGDLSVIEKLEDFEVERVKVQLEIAKKQYATKKSDESRDLVEQVMADLLRAEIGVYDARAQRYPEELNWKFHLGKKLKQAGNYAEAIKRLDEVRSDPTYKPAALLDIGECMQQLRQASKAMQCYTKAAEIAEAGSTTQKLALYRTGMLSIALKDRENAIKSFEALLKVDKEYKDAASRLDKLRAIDNKE